MTPEEIKQIVDALNQGGFHPAQIVQGLGPWGIVIYLLINRLWSERNFKKNGNATIKAELVMDDSTKEHQRTICDCAHQAVRHLELISKDQRETADRAQQILTIQQQKKR